MKLVTFLLYFVMCLLSGAAFAATFNVNSGADDDDVSVGNGVCATPSGECTLRAAITEANNLTGDDTIILPANTYNISSTLLINTGLTILGENRDTTLVSGNNTARLFTIGTSQTVNISGFTVQQGNGGTGGMGGGMYIAGTGSVTLSNMAIRNNSANSGAGIGYFSQSGTLTILDSVIENNQGISDQDSSSPWGGGIYMTGTATVNIENTSIRNNSSLFGGGIFLMSTNLTLRNATVSGNTATAPSNHNNGYGGGGIYVGSGNEATLVALNSTISGNKSTSNGAGILLVNGTVSLYNCTVTNNQADSDNDAIGYGGGIIGDNTPGSNAVYISNSIIAGNKETAGIRSDCDTRNLSISSYGYNLVGNTRGCIFTHAEGDIVPASGVTIDPMLEPLANNGGATQTHAILEGSPVVDRGNPSYCADNATNPLDTDQRGDNRHVDGGSGNARCDIGAYEATSAVYVDLDVPQLEREGNVESTASTSSGKRGADEDNGFKLGIQEYYEKRKGGCSLQPGAEFDPLLPLMVLLASARLYHRRKIYSKLP